MLVFFFILLLVLRLIASMVLPLYHVTNKPCPIHGELEKWSCFEERPAEACTTMEQLTQDPLLIEFVAEDHA